MPEQPTLETCDRPLDRGSYSCSPGSKTTPAGGDHHPISPNPKLLSMTEIKSDDFRRGEGEPSWIGRWSPRTDRGVAVLTQRPSAVACLME
jgi:hypothetical protein